MATVSLSELSFLVHEMFELEKNRKDIIDKVENIESQISSKKKNIINILLDNNLVKFHTKNGDVWIEERPSFKISDNNQVVEYFLNQGMRSLLTVNHNRLNSFIKEQMEELPNFKVPGTKENESYIILKKRIV